MHNTTVTELKKIAANTASKKGFDVVSLQLQSHLNPMTIQINIRHFDPKHEISISDCVLLNDPLNEALEESNLIDRPFSLEISSQGIHELLIHDRDFKTFKGFPVKVTYYDKKRKTHKENGLLLERSQNHLQINLKGRILRIPREDILEVRLTTPSG